MLRSTRYIFSLLVCDYSVVRSGVFSVDHSSCSDIEIVNVEMTSSLLILSKLSLLKRWSQTYTFIEIPISNFHYPSDFQFPTFNCTISYFMFSNRYYYSSFLYHFFNLYISSICHYVVFNISFHFWFLETCLHVFLKYFCLKFSH